MNTQTLRLYAPVVLRYAMALVMVWFGMQQLLHTNMWTAYVPASAVGITNLSLIALVKINGTIEVVLGVLLAIGWQVRWVAILLAAHLFDIMYIVGYGEIGVRDFGLAMATLSVAMYGNDILSVQPKH